MVSCSTKLFTEVSKALVMKTKVGSYVMLQMVIGYSLCIYYVLILQFPFKMVLLILYSQSISLRLQICLKSSKRKFKVPLRFQRSLSEGIVLMYVLATFNIFQAPRREQKNLKVQFQSMYQLLQLAIASISLSGQLP